MDIVKRLNPLFNPKSVAVIGATNNWNKWGHSTFTCVLNGYKGRIYPVNLKEKEVLGVKAYKSVLDIEDSLDLAVFVIPAEKIPPIMEECAKKGVKAAIIISAGFRETGEEGRELENEVIRAAGKGGICFVGPNCMGMWSASSCLRAYMFPLPLADGPIAFVTQGGNVGAAIAMSANERGLGMHRYVSCGPAADIKIEDYIEYFGQEDSVRVIMTYIEGLEDGRRFIEKVGKVTRNKPVIVLKPGKTLAAANAILSHSGALAGSDEIYDIAFRKAGALRVETPEELLDVAVAFLTQPLPRGKNVAIVTGGGSYGVLCAEYCASLGLDVVNLPHSTIDELSRIFPPRWSHGNPVDPAGDRNFLAYYLAPEIILSLNEIDSLIFMGFASAAGFSDLLSDKSPVAGGQIFSILSSMDGLDILIESIVSIMRTDDNAKIKEAVQPYQGILGSIFGADEKSTEKFVDLFLSGKTVKKAMIGLISLIPSLAAAARENSGPGEAVPGHIDEIINGLDKVISSLLLHFMQIHKKPIISTTFSETPSMLKAASYPYPTAMKAAFVLSKMAEYREYLDRAGVPYDPLRICSLLNQELD